MAKVLQGLIVAVLLAAFGLLVRLALLSYGADYIDHTVQTAMQPIQEQAKRDVYVARSQAEHHAPAPVGRQLASNERCIGGTIVRVEEINGVPTYTQVNNGAHPLACPQ